VEKAAAIDSVVFVVVRNVIGHNIGFWLVSCFWQVASHLSLLIQRAFIPEIFSHQSASRGNFPQFVLCGCYFSTLVFAKTPRSGVGPARRLNSGITVNHRLILSVPHLQRWPEN
jgi:hypothetical protein